MSVPDMRTLIQGASTEGQWGIVTGWRESAELVSAHRFQLEQFRDYLAEAWPPNKSEAAEAYRERLNVMIDSIIQTHDAALANYDALAGATGAVYQAQVRMEQIYNEYQNNQNLLNASPDSEPPPVDPARQEALRNEAAVMLSGVSTELAQAQARIVTPPVFKIQQGFDDNRQTITDSTFTAPPIPPLVPVSADDTSAVASSKPSTTFPVSSATPPVTAQPGIATPQPGLILGGTGTPTPPIATPPTTGLPVTPLPGGGGSPLPSPSLLPPTTLLPGGGQTGLPIAPGVARGLGGPREGLIRGAAPPSEGMRAMPSGGIIGGAPGAGIGRTGAARAGVSRVNPVGGVIGEGPGAAGARRGGMSPGEHPGGVYGQGGNRRPGGRDDKDGSHWDPDNPWETAEGVDPVVLPQQERRVDPGPAIGLS